MSETRQQNKSLNEAHVHMSLRSVSWHKLIKIPEHFSHTANICIITNGTIQWYL